MQRTCLPIASFASRNERCTIHDQSAASKLLRLHLNQRLYKLILEGTEKPLFFIEGKDVWRCGPASAFMRPGPPRLLLTCRLIATEASEILHELRELRFMAISHGSDTAPISCYHRFCSVDAFMPVLKRVRRLSLAVNTHAGPKDELCGMALLNFICTVLENRTTPLRGLRLTFDCCFSTSQVRCRDDWFHLAERFRLLGPIQVEHRPWNGKCTWANVCDTRTMTLPIMLQGLLTEQEAFARYLRAIEEGFYHLDQRVAPVRTTWASTALGELGKLGTFISKWRT